MLRNSEVSGGMMIRKACGSSVAVDLRQAEAHRAGRRGLPVGQRLDAGAHLLADPRGGEQAEADDHAEVGRGSRVEVLLEPGLQALGQQVGYQEVPDEQLHQQRHVAEDFHVGGGDPRYQAVRHGAHDAEQRAQRQGDDPADQGDGDGPAQTGDVPVEVGFAADPGGLEEHAPVPVVIHVGVSPRFNRLQTLAGKAGAGAAVRAGGAALPGRRLGRGRPSRVPEAPPRGGRRATLALREERQALVTSARRPCRSDWRSASSALRSWGS